jgi:hypothetical protein
MSIFREEATQMCEQAFRGWDVNVMQEAIRQGEIDPLVGQGGQFFCVTHQKPAFLAPQRIVNLAFISVYAKVIRMGKMAHVGSRPAFDIQNTPHLLQIVMSGAGRELLLGEESHPRPVNSRLSHDRF